jgi:hypothetical protein
MVAGKRFWRACEGSMGYHQFLRRSWRCPPAAHRHASQAPRTGQTRAEVAQEEIVQGLVELETVMRGPINEAQEIEKNLEHEEMYWNQRYIASWLRSADRNISFFHKLHQERIKLYQKMRNLVRDYVVLILSLSITSLISLRLRLGKQTQISWLRLPL